MTRSALRAEAAPLETLAEALGRSACVVREFDVPEAGAQLTARPTRTRAAFLFMREA